MLEDAGKSDKTINAYVEAEKDVRVSLINHLLRVDLAFFADKQVGFSTWEIK